MFEVSTPVTLKVSLEGPEGGEMSPRSFISLAAAWVLALAWLASANPALCQTGYSGADLQRMGQWLQFYHLDLYKLEIPP
jgi:hypothetical protein